MFNDGRQTHNSIILATCFFNIKLSNMHNDWHSVKKKVYIRICCNGVPYQKFEMHIGKFKRREWSRRKGPALVEELAPVSPSPRLLSPARARKYAGSVLYIYIGIGRTRDDARAWLGSLPRGPPVLLFYPSSRATVRCYMRCYIGVCIGPLSFVRYRPSCICARARPRLWDSARGEALSRAHSLPLEMML